MHNSLGQEMTNTLSNLIYISGSLTLISWPYFKWSKHPYLYKIAVRHSAARSGQGPLFQTSSPRLPLQHTPRWCRGTVTHGCSGTALTHRPADGGRQLGAPPRPLSKKSQLRVSYLTDLLALGFCEEEQLPSLASHHVSWAALGAGSWDTVPCRMRPESCPPREDSTRQRVPPLLFWSRTPGSLSRCLGGEKRKIAFWTVF